MDNFNQVFFSTMAQVSATFMGFALLVPCVQALSSGLTAKSEIIIASTKLLKRLLGLVGLPVTIFSVPFLTSLFILWIGIEKVQAHFDIIGVLLAISFLCWFGIILKHTILPIDSWILATLLTKVPLFLLELFFLLSILSCLQNLSIFAMIPLNQQQGLISGNILLIVIGLLVLIRNLSTTLEKNIKFKFGDLRTDYADKVKSLLNGVKTAIEERGKIIEKLKGQLKKAGLLARRKEDIKRSIGEHKAAIAAIQQVSEDTKKALEERLGKKGFTITECLEVEDWRKDVEKYLRDFERETLRAEKILKELGV